jgi:hypothetical protein
MTLVLLILRLTLRLLFWISEQLAGLVPPPSSTTGQLLVLWAEEKAEPDGTWTRALRVLVHIRRLPPPAAPILHSLFTAVTLTRRLWSSTVSAGRRLRDLLHRLHRAADSA